MKVRLLGAVGPLVLTTALTLAGCGAPAPGAGVARASGGEPPAASPSASMSRRDAQLRFAQCMREHGVDMKDPAPDGPIRIESRKGDQRKVGEAQEACRHFMEAAVGDRMGKIDQRELDGLLKFARCMREHGIPMADPSADGRIEISVPPDTPEAKVKAAQEACKEFAPGNGPK
ncbi:hypothetical protein Sme01_13630 [Sphaerisporangium melleum]|uniref:Secreted protein n=1 Tax=Sphaerisporangium melleum TaxID=321316 RepID=A0A917QTV6_9ACTN|nr:hypothetical protein [Sphaerisporangium melleum]GGK68463.1 hypothetical protein GCM10007964_09230 [Sphaerisporangium melleum]GII68887.1 hypothetical protein Sme01_13630 [Sphaerisporangium melleum]